MTTKKAAVRRKLSPRLHRSIRSYAAARLIAAGTALDGRDKVGFGLFCDMLFWANEYAGRLAFERLPNFAENRKFYAACGALNRRQAALENARETYLADLDALVGEHIRLRHFNRLFPGEQAKLRLACYLSLYYTEG